MTKFAKTDIKEIENRIVTTFIKEIECVIKILPQKENFQITFFKEGNHINLTQTLLKDEGGSESFLICYMRSE